MKVGPVAIFVSAVLLLSACSSAATALPASAKKYTVDQLCVILEDTIGPLAVGKTVLWPADDPNPTPKTASCVVQDQQKKGVSLRLTVSDLPPQMSQVIAINKSLASGKGAGCDKGANLIDISMGGKVESSLICQRPSGSVLTYEGEFGTSTISFRVERPTSMGAISKDAASGWLAQLSTAMRAAAKS